MEKEEPVVVPIIREEETDDEKKEREFRILLEAHDFWYMYVEDPEYVKKSEAYVDMLLKEQELNPSLIPIYEKRYENEYGKFSPFDIDLIDKV